LTDIDNAQIASWLAPVGIEMTTERLEQMVAVVDELRQDIEGHELEAVRAAHGDLSDSARGWAAAVLGQRSPTSVAGDAEDLLEHLIACAVIGAFDESDRGSICALAALSADFVGLSPVLPELTQMARDSLDESGQSLRSRPEQEDGAVLKVLGKLPALRKPTRDEEQTVIEHVAVDDLAEDVGKHASGLTALARQVDEELSALVDRQRALDEEVEMLWWALRAIDDSGTPSATRDASRRAALAASELSDRTSLIPGPPSARYLLTTVLGRDAATEVALGDLAAVADEALNALSVPQDRLLPIMSAAVDHHRGATGEDDASWRNVAGNTLGLDLSTKTALTVGAQQIYRELLLERLLSASE
jgi:hypothetical protein